MKTFRLVAALLMVALCFNFVSCSKDEEGSNPEKQTKRLTSISFRESGGDRQVLQIEYANDKVAKTIWTSHSANLGTSTETCAYTYSGNTVKESSTYISRDGDSDSDIITYTLNDNGYATKDDRGLEFNYSGKCLAAIVDTEDTSGKGVSEEFTFNKEGLVTSCGDYDYVEYTDIPNIGNLFLTYGDNVPFAIGYPLYVGILGNAPKYLPKIADRDTFTYELDEDGYVKSCTYTQRGDDDDKTFLVIWEGTLTYEPNE